MRYPKITLLLCTVLASFLSCQKSEVQTNLEEKLSLRAASPGLSGYEVPLGGNAFVTSAPSGAVEVINSNGLANWTNANSVISTYAKVPQAGALRVKIRTKVLPSGDSSTVKLTINGVSKQIKLKGGTLQDYTVGTYSLNTAGYIKMDLQGVTKSGGYFADVSHLILDSSATNGTVIYSDNNVDNTYYWSRRGPSCHFSYTIPTNQQVSYYYSEVKVPAGEDKIGSYFMANGFGQGYFGMQVNSATERRILFSVWSPYSTDNPSQIPAEDRITLNRKGTNTTTGEFGGEGSGGQSYLKYNWTAATTYKFLLKGEPDNNGSTDFTAWFNDPSTNNWILIASWKRPKTNTYLTGFHSFLENFNADNGFLGRSAEYSNQWVRTATGTWLKVVESTFTVDATYSNNQRIDAIGGTTGNSFFLKNGGFFNTVVNPGTKFTQPGSGTAPSINLTTLP
ncbi:DUF3472 domain-containing protein [Sphingobacterium paramultivorum]|uniref:DUF3472 domain-containing protein n=1 Tax=Sphingobacterium paramultivorum TaxID=2886510 RepID=A0A7G5E130_9SPHI|nr:DUF3472 domain-containing protein [Sphingobacterium paramultivorum]QMV67705.1 DUF3472 domain-containing protein [Sphingobacterium paramultivorum]WSO16589.1 DUF3472 domain-containing protein [Sphingobacterium paramultivorum]